MMMLSVEQWGRIELLYSLYNNRGSTLQSNNVAKASYSEGRVQFVLDGGVQSEVIEATTNRVPFSGVTNAYDRFGYSYVIVGMRKTEE